MFAGSAQPGPEEQPARNRQSLVPEPALSTAPKITPQRGLCPSPDRNKAKPPPKDPFHLCAYISMGRGPLQEVMLPKLLLPSTEAVSRSLLPGCNHASLQHGAWGAGAVAAGKWGPEPRRSPQGPWPSPEMFVPLVPIRRGAQYAPRWGRGGTRGFPPWCKGHKLPTLQALPTPKTPAAPTSGRQLLGVDDFGRILLSCQHLHASPDDGESAPGKTRSQREVKSSVGARTWLSPNVLRGEGSDGDGDGAGAGDGDRYQLRKELLRGEETRWVLRQLPGTTVLGDVGTGIYRHGDERRICPLAPSWHSTGTVHLSSLQALPCPAPGREQATIYQELWLPRDTRNG